jgi:hypothetical protein
VEHDSDVQELGESEMTGEARRAFDHKVTPRPKAEILLDPGCLKSNARR